MKSDGERYGFIRIEGENVPLTKRGFVWLRLVPAIVLLVVWFVFIGN
jgi:hypothetical protein